MVSPIRNKAVSPKSAWTMLCERQEQQSSSTRQPLHLANHPSFPLHLGVNALAGPAGSGKTQLCLSLVADCAWHHQKAVYISLGKDTTISTSQRLHSILKHRKKLKLGTTIQQGPTSSNMDQAIKEEYLTKIFVNWVRNQDDLLHMLYNGLPKLLKDHNDSIALVVLDGIATLFRGKKEGKYHWVERSAQFFQIASQSQRLSFSHKVPIVFTNQVTSKWNSSGESHLEPALGLSWAQCINSSYFIIQTNSSKRMLKCIKSSHLSTNKRAEFVIEQRGTVRIE